MDTLIVEFERDVIHELEVVGDGDALGAAGGMGQEAVVIATTTA